jgi:hypothetical protein
MNTLSLKQFKQLRKAEGTWFAVFSTLARAGVDEDRAEHFVDGLSCDLGRRKVEKMKSKHIHELLDGFITFCEEHMLLAHH